MTATTTSRRTGPAVRARRIRRSPSFGFHRFSGLYLWAVIILIFGIWVPETFLTVDTARVIASDQAITAMLALAAMLPLVCGSFDLSVAQTMGTSSVLVAYLQFEGTPVLLAIGITLAAGLVIGAVNALAVVKFRVNSFIATLAMTSVLAALTQMLTDSRDVTTGFSQDLLDVGRWMVPGLEVSSAVVVLVVMALALWYFLELRPAGRAMYAVGDNPAAADLSGLRSARVVASSFVLSSLLATVLGIVYMAQVGVGSLATGPSYLLPAFAAVFLGATQIVPGRFNVIGTLIAVYALNTGVKGLQLAVSAPWATELFVGVALLVAVALAERGRSRSA